MNTYTIFSLSLLRTAWFIGCFLWLLTENAKALPSVCSVVKTSQFNDCVGLSISPSVCGFPIPRPCAHFSYYVPETFIEVVSNRKETFFDLLPGAAVQLATLSKGLPFGNEEDNGAFSFQAHVLSVPFVSIPFQTMPCSEFPEERFCFSMMSEHVDSHWRTGSADRWQPKYLAWSLAPKLCLIKGALTSTTGEEGGPPSFSSPFCSFPNPLPIYPPSTRSVCNGWGILFPRYGTYDGSSQTVAALMIADRIRSLGVEVSKTVPSSGDEKWQMIYPGATSCFREGQNVGFLETLKGVNDIGRITSGKLKNYLFVIWKKVSCTKDIPYIASTIAGLAVMKGVCSAL